MQHSPQSNGSSPATEIPATVTPQRPSLRRIAVDYDSRDEERSWSQIVREQWYAFRSAVLQSEVYFRLTISDAKQRKGSFCLAFLSIMLVVLLTGLLVTTLSHLQVIFLRLAETANGKIDLVLTPGGQFSNANSLNYSMITNLFPSGPTSYHAARIILHSMTLFAWSGCNTYAQNRTALWYPPSGVNVSDPALAGCSLSASSCPWAHCSGKSRPVTLAFMDADREERMALTGGNWPYRPGPGEIALDAVAASSLGVNLGDTVIIAGDASYPLMEAYDEAGLNDLGLAKGLQYSSYGTAVYRFKLTSLITSYDEKFEANVVLGFLAVANFADAISATASALSPAVPASNSSRFGAIPSAYCASSVYINMPPDSREGIYSQRDYQDIQNGLMRFAAGVFGTIGFNQVSIATPVLTYLSTTTFFSLFLGLIISLILVALSVLSMVLVYSLLTVNIQTRTFEMGLQRILGFTKQNLTGLVFTNAMFFTLPAVVVGLVLAQVGYTILRRTLTDLLDVNLPTTLSGNGIGFGILAGLGIPLIAAIAPVMDVLTLSLPDALTSDRSKITGVLFNVHGGRDRGYFSTTVVLLGVSFTVYSFLIYYLFPLSILDFNITLLFYIFFFILVAMLGGLVLLSINFERVLETALTYILLFWEEQAVFSLIGKNLIAHRQRNRKTTLMYALSLGFILFITVAFTIQLNSVEYSSLQFMGEDVRYQGNFQWEQFVELDRALHAEELKDRISGITYLSDDLLGMVSGIANTTLANIGQFQFRNVKYMTVPPNFFDTIDPSFLIVGDALPSPFSISETLYTLDGSGRVVISSADRDVLNLQSFDDPFLLVSADAGLNLKRVVTASSAWLDSSAVVRASKLPSSSGQSCLFSLPSAVGRSSGALRSIRDIKMESFFARATQANVPYVTSAIAAVGTTYSFAFKPNDMYSTKSTLSTATLIVNIFFTFAQVMAMVICFFALLSTMSTNVLHQSKEIGVLRCIGMHRFPIYRLFTWESFILVLSASLLGMFVGTVVAYSMMLQSALFTQIPVKFVFPVTQLVAVLVTASICSVIASYSPVAYLLNLPSITHILRRVM